MFILIEWTINSQEEELGGMKIGDINHILLKDPEDTGFHFEQMAMENGCDEEETNNIRNKIEKRKIPKEGFTIHNDEGHYIYVNKESPK